jgi:hypothetical protein
MDTVNLRKQIKRNKKAVSSKIKIAHSYNKIEKRADALY